MAKSMTEDAVRDLAREALGLVDSEIARAGVGQLTTFNQLGFPGVADKPDGWYLPNNKNEVAVVLETKATRITLGQAQVDEVLKNVRIMQTQYKKVVGILYNGEDIRVFKGEEEVKTPTKLQSVSYYLSLYTVDSIDKERIYELTAKINNGLHFEFGIKNLYHRMIFTACALVAERYGAGLRRLKNMGYATFHTAIHSTLSKSLEDSRKQNAKIDILLEEYSDIKMNTTDNQQAINDFIDWIVEISECVNSNEWRGEDVMGIFFNEFNRYKKKSEAGQVFTPEHITDFMYKILDVNKDDYILDATCGSGGFLVKAMANMIREAGGMQADAAAEIKSNHLYGIEFDREIYALACANMLIHKDGKTNLEQILRGRYDFIRKMTRAEMLKLKVKLPAVIQADGTYIPDWAYMGTYMSEVMQNAETYFKILRKADGDRHEVDTANWREFRVGDLFQNIVKPVVLHTRQVVESPEGIPYVVRTKFNNGIKCRVQPVTGVTPSPAGVISWGAENATFFYQPEPFLSGRDIYYIDTREFNPLVCMFLASCLQTVVHKYPYNFGLFPDLLKEEKIKLPVIADGTPDWIYMGEYMRMRMESAKTDLVNMQSAL